MALDNEDRTTHSSVPPLFGMQGVISSSRPPTESSLASWSWRDMAHGLAGAVLGALAGGMLAAWLMPDIASSPHYTKRALVSASIFLCWALPLTAGMCLDAGQRLRAPRAWARQAARAVLTAGGGALIAATVAALPIPFVPLSARFPFQPLLSWTLLGVAIGMGMTAGFPRERHRAQTWCAGLIAGLLTGALFPGIVALADGLHGAAARPAFHLAALIPAGLFLGFMHVALRELAKREWLLVIFGDQPGRHYPLYGAPFTIGTAPDNMLVLPPTGMVQPAHAVILHREGRAVVEAASPASLVCLHDRMLAVSELYDGDDLQIGETVLRYYVVQ